MYGAAVLLTLAIGVALCCERWILGLLCRPLSAALSGGALMPAHSGLRPESNTSASILTPLSHTHIQVLLAISNSIASIPGVGAGVLTGQLLVPRDDWRLMFSIAAAVQAAGALIFLCFADVCEQNFDGLALRSSIQQRSVDQASCVPSHTEPLITDA